jgi:limonene-1,2-epoxide hydrolase
MKSPVQVVEEFCRALSDGPDGLRQALRQWFTPDTVWVNTGIVTTTGIEEALALIDQFEEAAGIAAIQIDIKAIAADHNKILTERVDHMINRSGERIKSDLVMGIFEVEGERIIAWRDYFDSAAAMSPSH